MTRQCRICNGTRTVAYEPVNHGSSAWVTDWCYMCGPPPEELKPKEDVMGIDDMIEAAQIEHEAAMTPEELAVYRENMREIYR